MIVYSSNRVYQRDVGLARVEGMELKFYSLHAVLCSTL
jgi:hypothetical protein